MGNEINSLSVLLHAIRLKFKEMFKPDDFVSEANIDSDPFQQFSKWYNKAVRSRIPFYEAMNLSTADTDGKPSSRMVLLKAFNKDGFVFYTNSNSRKGKEISGNPYVSVTFYWNKLGRQIRIEGLLKVYLKRSLMIILLHVQGVASWELGLLIKAVLLLTEIH